jgi:hypothetical protein
MLAMVSHVETDGISCTFPSALQATGYGPARLLKLPSSLRGGGGCAPFRAIIWLVEFDAECRARAIYQTSTPFLDIMMNY